MQTHFILVGLMDSDDEGPENNGRYYTVLIGEGEGFNRFCYKVVRRHDYLVGALHTAEIVRDAKPEPGLSIFVERGIEG